MNNRVTFTFESEADLNAALRAIGTASEEGEIENGFETYCTDSDNTVSVVFTKREANACMDNLKDIEDEAGNNPYLDDRMRETYESARLRFWSALYPNNPAG